QTSWAAAGMLTPIHELEFSELELLNLGRRCLDYYTVIEETFGNLEINKTGTIEIAVNTDDLQYLKRLFQFQRQQNLPVYWLTPSEVCEREPMISPKIAGGIFSATDIQINHRAFLLSLIEYVREKGSLIEQLEVTDWLNRSDSIEVFTNRGNFFTKCLIFTTGSEPQNIPLPFRIYPVKGQMISLEPIQLKHTIRIRSRIFGNGYLVPKQDRLILGSTSEEMGRDPRLTAGGLLDILRRAYTVLPGIYDLAVLETWTGKRPSTINRNPILAKDKKFPIYYLNGLYRHGILMGPYLGKLLVDWILHQELPEFARPYQQLVE
ncbi:MAG: FAD-binding oxidoreductase, partial [Bacteroidia bacterium]|nr:FAD-binding oxidoreductase [Bacteroidia bacterium]